jgi:hypothetical protein
MRRTRTKAHVVGAALCVLVLTAPLLVTPARAQDSVSTAGASRRFSAAEIANFSKQIEGSLADQGARVAIVFRAGRARDKLPQGIAYTHGAFWVYRDVQTSEGAVEPGYAVYNLYAGDGKAWPTTVSRLVQDFPYDFTAGSAVDDVAVIIPSPEMQRRLLAVIDSPAYAALHNPAYSLVANPLSPKYQNCNGFMLDVIASAAWGTDDRDQIRADLRAHYKPTKVQTSAVTRVFAPLADARLRTDDQSGPIRTATYESIAAFMLENGLLKATYSVDFDRAAVP